MLTALASMGSVGAMPVLAFQAVLVFQRHVKKKTCRVGGSTPVKVYNFEIPPFLFHLCKPFDIQAMTLGMITQYYTYVHEARMSRVGPALQGQSMDRAAWFNATLDGRCMVQSGKWLLPMDLQQWPRSLPNRGTLELDVLQLPLSKVPWIAHDGSICIGGKQVAPNAAAAAVAPTAAVTAGLSAASGMPVVQSSEMAQVAGIDEEGVDVVDEPDTDSVAAEGNEQADAEISSDDGMSESHDHGEGLDTDVTGAASSAVQSVPV